MKTSLTRTALFGPYELDLRSAELRKFGTRVRMGEQTFQILCLLLEARGELVTREELQAKLWAGDTFVDFDHGLNSAVQRLRDCLSDSAEKPRWVETVPRRGYRFIGQVEWPENGLSGEAAAPLPESEHTNSSSSNGSAPSTPRQQTEEEKGQPTVWGRVAWFSAVTLVLLLAGVLIFKRIQQTRDAARAKLIRSIAVLPLENLSGDPAQEYFADGMTDEVITVLAKNPALQVTSRTSVMQYKKVHRPLREIARELGVDGILEGSVGRFGNRVRVTAQLIYAPTDTHVWAESFDRDLGDVGSLQNELAQLIAQQVGVTTSGSGTRDRKIKPEAHDAYLLGRYYWFGSEYQKSRELFQKALDLQPDYAAAWGGVADSYTASAASGEFPPEAVMPKAEAAARKSLELDDQAAEAHASMAAIYLFYRWDWQAADKESIRSLELNPSLAEAHHLRAYVLSALNRNDESVQEEKKGMDLDPFARPWALGYALIRARRFDAALEESRLRSDGVPNDPILRSLLSSAYIYKGMDKEAAEAWERALVLSNEKEAGDATRQAFDHGGIKALLEWDLNWNKQKAARQYISPLDFANDSGLLERQEETLGYLEQAYRERAPFMIHIQCNPNFDFLHAEPRYRAIVKKMDLPPAF
jgi:TolB-like protein/DNA-binding winged helix-turn-helix (wHTH) protein